ncbi:Avirulence induced gene (AIG1) family protein [Trifolium repens]|nr:Avirulence induced gene (AIG1) family protein [Trifolium repens]
MFATWLVRPVLETHGWDRDVGYEGLNVERLFVLKNKIPLSFSGQVTKDKKDANVQMEMANKFVANKQFELVIAEGAMAGHDDVAYGGSLEARLRDKNHPLGRTLSTLVISVMDWHGDLAVGCNLQSHIPI